MVPVCVTDASNVELNSRAPVRGLGFVTGDRRSSCVSAEPSLSDAPRRGLNSAARTGLGNFQEKAHEETWQDGHAN